MKQITLYLTAIIILAAIGSCKKNKIITPSVTYPNYSGLKVGNYWIYQQFDVDENGIAKSKNIFDSCYVEKDTVIRGKTYYKFVKTGDFYEISFQRDSLHYLVNSIGQILFSSEDFEPRINNRNSITVENRVIPEFRSLERYIFKYLSAIPKSSNIALFNFITNSYR